MEKVDEEISEGSAEAEGETKMESGRIDRGCCSLRGIQWRIKLGILRSSKFFVDELRRAAADGRRKYQCGSKIGKGSFGEVYVGTDLERNEHVAIKTESLDAGCPVLHHEYTVYRAISGGTGIPNVRWRGMERGHDILVMDLLGPPLAVLFQDCGYKFSLKTVLMLADQMIERIQHLHERGFVHRDLKPDNFLMAKGKKSGVVHMIDFGLAKSFRNPRTLIHIPEKATNGLIGNARYASINNHNGVEPSRRDDMESLGYLLLRFLRGSLPWQKYETMRQKKTATSIESLFESHKEFVSYFHYCRSLGFEDTPDYAYLRGLFRDVFVSKGFQYDNEFDWTPLLEKETKAKATTATPAVDRAPRDI